LCGFAGLLNGAGAIVGLRVHPFIITWAAWRSIAAIALLSATKGESVGDFPS